MLWAYLKNIKLFIHMYTYGFFLDNIIFLTNINEIMQGESGVIQLGFYSISINLLGLHSNCIRLKPFR